MSERGHSRAGGRGGQRGARGGHDRGGRGGGAQAGQQQERPKKENILDLTKYMHKQVQVKFNGGREGNPTSLGRPCLGGKKQSTDHCAVVGTLEGYDGLMNLVLDHVKETMRGTRPRAVVFSCKD